MTRIENLPIDHAWFRTDHGRMSFACEDCGVAVPVTASDIQAGIRLYCPECNGEMEPVSHV